MILNIEISETPLELERGLMYRKKLAEDAGMLFVFKKPQKLNFWGSSTYIPLDIAFIDKDNKISKLSKIDALSLKTISSDGECVMALETNRGFFDKYNITEGFQFHFDKIYGDNKGMGYFNKDM